MPVDKDLLRYIESELSTKIERVTPVSGGSINAAYCLQTPGEKYFIKMNSKDAFLGMFKSESDGLSIIKQTNTIAVPRVIFQCDHGTESFILMEWIDSRRPDADSSALLGSQLAQMHRRTAAQFGNLADNYMGSLKQSNRSHTTWSGFFIAERLNPMVQLAHDKALINSTDRIKFEHLYEKLPGLFDEEPPSLLHGDLWGGNYLIGTSNKPCLIDPAVSYGHREFDIAMTTLFGGFSKEFYEAYHHNFPLTSDWQQRLDLWNLYPLLVHLNLFGLGYLGQVRDVLDQYL